MKSADFQLYYVTNLAESTHTRRYKRRGHVHQYSYSNLRTVPVYGKQQDPTLISLNYD